MQSRHTQDVHMKTRTRHICLLAGWLAISGVLHAAENIVIADFERDDYGDWKADGEAFGPGPAKGTLPGQMHVSGYKGERLVNSFFDGDKVTGTLTSPPILIERDYLSFLIGGGAHPKKTCINLLLGGEVVRTATGPNSDPGGSEQLEPRAWDVTELKGKTVAIQIVDQATGGWGHINIDHIVQTDEKPKVPEYQNREGIHGLEQVPLSSRSRTARKLPNSPLRSRECPSDATKLNWPPIRKTSIGTLSSRSIPTRASQPG